MENTCACYRCDVCITDIGRTNLNFQNVNCYCRLQNCNSQLQYFPSALYHHTNAKRKAQVQGQRLVNSIIERAHLPLGGSSCSHTVDIRQEHTDL